MLDLKRPPQLDERAIGRAALMRQVDDDVTFRQLDDVHGRVEEAVRDGARVLCGGRRPPKIRKGFFYEPTVIDSVRQDMRLVRTETFGPILPLMRVTGIDDAIEKANDSRYGLGANIYTRNLEWSMKAMEKITAGTFWINDPLTDNDAGPFGGMRQTGHSRELGEEGLDAFRETKHVHLDYVQEVKPYWYPYAKYQSGRVGTTGVRRRPLARGHGPGARPRAVPDG